MLSGKKILLGISAGIAAYKTASLVRLLVKSGAEVRVVMTPDAKSFVAPLTLSTLTNHPVLSSFTDTDEDHAVWNNHVTLGLWADFFVLAPATANTLAKMAQGASDNFLLATYLSLKCPVYFAPAMDLDMHAHPATQASFARLQSYGNIMIPAEHGELASGLVGQGRMAEPENIMAFIEHDLRSKAPLNGQHYLITAGPTFELIDPVRYIGNFSSGKMGYALANRAAELGAKVTLVSGPTKDLSLHPEILKIDVITGTEMFDAVSSVFDSCHVAVLCAAVADFKPKEQSDQKIKNKTEDWTLSLKPTRDIAQTLGERKADQCLVGFALETQDGLAQAKMKLKKKNLDIIVLNSLGDKGVAFGADTNKITIVESNGTHSTYPVKLKTEVAADVIDFIIQKHHA